MIMYAKQSSRIRTYNLLNQIIHYKSKSEEKGLRLFLDLENIIGLM